MQCDFQTNNKSLLRNHINLQHTKEQDRDKIDCDQCETECSSAWHLRNHIRDAHDSQEDCTFYQTNRCKFGSSCWKLHRTTTTESAFTCFSCKDTFKNMNDLMRHRNSKHIELCKPCMPKEGKCKFEKDTDRCWFIHKDFQKVSNKQDPPLVKSVTRNPKETSM